MILIVVLFGIFLRKTLDVWENVLNVSCCPANLVPFVWR